jgi:FAD/FMN-containing dehydrogenase
MATEISAIRGDVVAPDDHGWDTARQAWNLAADQRPALVVVPVDAADVLAVVEFARSSGMQVAAQGTGHNASAIASLENTILLSTRRMRGVEIDADARIARVEAGTLAAEVCEAATEAGLFPPDSPNVPSTRPRSSPAKTTSGCRPCEPTSTPTG